MSARERLQDAIRAEFVELERQRDVWKDAALKTGQKLVLAESKLAEFDQIWDGEKYCFTPRAESALSGKPTEGKRG